ncbi:hypothetical protein AQUCO_00300016v1 [Aquilegia coerulea]|uniref:Late embryogenesis abundant protein LEA-2 subgroup domain-containing protein n=1 Tax=Aquilegia coerulea TaxID=218851 RepID=A0A2G5EWW4_AQUCA|nr:hypothetical protein AQUCO_00300016v1 [Aquilegia coerulea]
MEMEGQSQKTKKSLLKHRNCHIFMALFLISHIIPLILLFTVFKFKNTNNQNSLHKNFRRVSAQALKIELYITLGLKIEVRNPNYFSLKLGEGGDILPGKIGSKVSNTIDCRLTLQPDKFKQGSLARDVLRGALGLEISARLPGRVTNLGFLKKHLVALASCQLYSGSIIRSFEVRVLLQSQVLMHLEFSAGSRSMHL